MIGHLFYCFIAYLIGSISSAVLICRLMGLPDPRLQGSQNPGATNVLRSGSRSAAFLTLACDLLKGFLPVLWAIHLQYSERWVGLVMVAVVLGHLYPLFFRFKGGKGVATAAGVFLALDTVMGLILILVWLLLLRLSRVAALAAVLVACIAPFYGLWVLGEWAVLPVGVISLLIIWRHRSNLKRLWKGIEPRIKWKQ